MVEFRTMYYGPMDRQYHQAVSEVQKDVKLEEPIFPIGQIGETVPERDPAGRFRNMLQHTQAAIRGGAGTIQLVMSTPPGSAMGGFKSHGKEVREAMKEVFMASKTNLASVEMPTALNNLSGFDYQQNVFTEEKRKQHLDEVKDAIRFVADVGRGGGIDLVSWEFQRSINAAGLQAKDKEGKYYNSGEPGTIMLVDDRNGRTTMMRKTEILHLPYNKETFEKMSPTEMEFGREKELELSSFSWDDFVRWAEHETKKRGHTVKPEELYVEKQIEGQMNSLIGWRSTYLNRAEDAKKNIVEVEKLLGDPEKLKELEEKGKTKEQIQKDLEKMRSEYNDSLSTAYGQAQQIKELQERVAHLKPIEDYAIGLSAKGYAEAGVAAMKATMEGKEKGTVVKDIYVGPEIGWPGFYGSHPQEFINLVKTARKEMVELLTNEKTTDMFGKQIENPYYDKNQRISKEQAEEMAKKHIKGLFDTGHMGMWLSYFKPKPGESETDRIARFNNWYTEQVEEIAKSGVVGGIQLVDSMSGAHGHLPAGQGIFPIKQTAEIFKKAGYGGFMVSEGHEEEQFGEGRIRTKTWQALGSPIGGGYFGGAPLQWRQVGGNYFGKTYSPMFMFGSYAPSNEFKLWSEVPFE